MADIRLDGTLGGRALHFRERRFATNPRVQVPERLVSQVEERIPGTGLPAGIVDRTAVALVGGAQLRGVLDPVVLQGPVRNELDHGQQEARLVRAGARAGVHVDPQPTELIGVPVRRRCFPLHHRFVAPFNHL